MKSKHIFIVVFLLFSLFLGIACKQQQPSINVEITDAYKEITVPTESFSLFTSMRQKHFSGNEILRFIDLLPGNTSQLYSVYEMGKDELQHIVDNARTGNSFSASVDQMQERVNRMAKEESTISPLTFSDLNYGIIEEVYFLNGANVSTCAFVLGGDLFTFFRDKQMNIMGEGLCIDGILNGTHGSANDYDHWLLPENPGISRDDAFKIAQSYLQALGADLDVFFEEPCTILNCGLIKSTGWKFVFTRSIGGLKSQFRDGQWCIVNPNDLPVIGAPWEQEVCVITVDGDGLCQIWWQGASEISNIEKTAIEIYPFSSIRPGLDDRLWSLHADQDHLEQMLEVQITNVQLGIAMIAIDSKYEEGQYIPCWYVDYKHRWNFASGSSYWEDDQVVFSAIDGSYIEPRIKDEKLKELANYD